MNENKEEFKRLIYELMIDARNLEDYPVEESKVIVDEFKDGMYCSNAYEEVYKANQSLCERLNTEEDKDVECIISNLLSIAEHLSMKMYDYGEYYIRIARDEKMDEIFQFYENLDIQQKVDFMKFLSSLQKLVKADDTCF